MSRIGVLPAVLLLAAATACAPAIEAAGPPHGAIAPVAVVTVQPSECRAGYVALTFDDGPSNLTPKFTHYLSAQSVPATFFVVGDRVQVLPGTVRTEQKLGFAIGNHTWDHAALPSLTPQGVRHQVRATARLLAQQHVRPSTLMRPPYGAIDERVAAQMRTEHLVPLLWTIDSEDWASGDARTIANRVLRQIRPHANNVVLMHDGLSARVNGRIASLQSARALPLIVPAARKRGYCFTAPGRAGWSGAVRGMAWSAPVARTKAPGLRAQVTARTG